MQKAAVVLVEDDTFLAGSLSELLEFFDLDVEWIENGLQASRRLGEIVPRLVLLDLHMPGRSGLDVLTDIRADYRLRGTRVLVTTADNTISLSRLSLADAVLIKPFTVEALQTVIDYLMDGEHDSGVEPQRWPNGF